MYTMTFNQASQDFASVIQGVCADHAPLLITGDDTPPVVMMSLADYNSWQETMHLLGSPNNAARLLEAMRQFKTEKVIEKSLQDLEMLAR
jgi:antitoxin YefM